MRDDGTLDYCRGLDQNGGSKSHKMSSDSGYVSKVQLTEFSDREKGRKPVIAGRFCMSSCR